MTDATTERETDEAKEVRLLVRSATRGLSLRLVAWMVASLAGGVALALLARHLEPDHPPVWLAVFFAGAIGSATVLRPLLVQRALRRLERRGEQLTETQRKTLTEDDSAGNGSGGEGRLERFVRRRLRAGGR